MITIIKNRLMITNHKLKIYCIGKDSNFTEYGDVETVPT